MTTEGRHGGPGLTIGRDTMEPIREFIAGASGKPFFIWYAPLMPHTPHNPPERILNRYGVEGRHQWVANYFAMVEWFDETCGELLGMLDDQGLRDNTLVVFLVDNGWIQVTEPMKHPSVARNVRFHPKSKASPYDGGLRTPIMLRWPGRVKPGRYYDLVSTLDLAPTILSALGLEPAERMQGLNLLDVATGRKPRLERDAIFGEVFLHTAASVEEPARNLTHRWVRQRDWKLIVPAAPGAGPELYNVVLDPTEAQNLAGKQPERAERLANLLDTWWDGK
jgi:uncharacterized sulfatase